MTSSKDDQRHEDALRSLIAAHSELDRVRLQLRGRDLDLPGGSMSHARYNLLWRLGGEEPTTLRDLARSMGFTATTISRMLEPLVVEGFVTRVPSKKDRRAVVLTLTKKGQKMVATRSAFWEGRWLRTFGNVDIRIMEDGARAFEYITRIYEDPETPIEFNGDP
jgi:DNA-binding MarR family transcriptional regulator